MIAGDDDHKLENNPGRVKALEAAAAVNALAVFPQLSAEQREQDMTDFNDLGRVQPEVNMPYDLFFSYRRHDLNRSRPLLEQAATVD